VQGANLGKTTESHPSVWVLDSDAVSRTLVQQLLERHSITVTCCESARRFSMTYQPGSASCLVIEPRLADGDGLAVQQELSSLGDLLPMVFLAAQADVPTAVQAMKGGAADFLLKPLDPIALMNAVQAAIARASRYRLFHDSALIARRLQGLTEREREVLDLVVSGLSTKQISTRLHRVEKTVEFHRQNIMRKLGANNVAHLVRLVTTADHAVLQRQPRANGHTTTGKDSSIRSV
jgi:two-component system, LuxR family, response regulator FixJ